MLWYLIFLLLAVEVALVAILCLPIPVIGAGLAKSLTAAWTQSSKLRSGTLIVFGIVLLLFIDSMYRLQAFDNSDADSKMGLSKSGPRGGSPGLGNPMALTLLFRNQRNAYISGFCLILSVVLHRLLDNARLLYKFKRENKQLRVRLGLPASGDLPEEAKDSGKDSGNGKADKLKAAAAAALGSKTTAATPAVRTENVASAPAKELLDKKNE